jgi:hypothetical protein
MLVLPVPGSPPKTIRSEFEVEKASESPTLQSLHAQGSILCADAGRAYSVGVI